MIFRQGWRGVLSGRLAQMPASRRYPGRGAEGDDAVIVERPDRAPIAVASDRPTSAEMIVDGEELALDQVRLTAMTRSATSAIFAHGEIEFLIVEDQPSSTSGRGRIRGSRQPGGAEADGGGETRSVPVVLRGSFDVSGSGPARASASPRALNRSSPCRSDQAINGHEKQRHAEIARGRDLICHRRLAHSRTNLAC